jgi:hypothetical protein
MSCACSASSRRSTRAIASRTWRDTWVDAPARRAVDSRHSGRRVWRARRGAVPGHAARRETGTSPPGGSETVAASSDELAKGSSIAGHGDHGMPCLLPLPGPVMPRHARGLAIQVMALSVTAMNTTMLEGRTALITGSTSGIGEAIARRLADQSAHVLDQRPRPGTREGSTRRNHRRWGTRILRRRRLAAAPSVRSSCPSTSPRVSRSSPRPTPPSSTAKPGSSTARSQRPGRAKPGRNTTLPVHQGEIRPMPMQNWTGNRRRAGRAGSPLSCNYG